MGNDTMYISSVDYAYSVLKTKILAGELKQGGRLSKRKMAELAGTSVIPVIGALYKLEEDGLVENVERWGARVAIFDKERIRDLYMLRQAIECQVVRILAKEMTDQQYQECLVIADKLDSLKYAEHELEKITEVHLSFHMKMAEMTGYPSLIRNLERCNLKWLLCTADQTVKELRELPEHWHKRILDAIMTRDPVVAETAMYEHIYDSFKDIMN